MMEACLAAGADYLDITGEIDVIVAAAARSERATARRRGPDSGRRLRRRAQRLPGGDAGRAIARGAGACNWPSPAAAA